MTKRGLGSAMQLARQKSREVAERRRTKAQNELDFFETPSEHILENEQDSAISEDSQIDKQPPTSVHIIQRSEVPAGGDTNDPLENSGGLGMRQRLENAVRSVRQSNVDPSTESSRNGNRFGFRLRGTAKGSEDDGAPEAMDVRNVSIHGTLQDQTHPLGADYLGKELASKRLDCTWFARVKLNDAPLPCTDGNEPPSVDRNSSPIALAVGLVDPLQQENTAATESPPEHFELTAPIHVYRQEPQAGLMDRPVSSVVVPLSSVYALHSSISECVGRLPPPASYHSATPRNESAALPWSLAVAFGLTPLDTVRVTGTLLGGLLRCKQDTGEYSIVPISEYHGEFVLS